MSHREERSPACFSSLYDQDEEEGLSSNVFKKEGDRDTHPLPYPDPSPEGLSGIGISKRGSSLDESMVTKDSLPSFFPRHEGIRDGGSGRRDSMFHGKNLKERDFEE